MAMVLLTELAGQLGFDDLREQTSLSRTGVKGLKARIEASNILYEVSL